MDSRNRPVRHISEVLPEGFDDTGMHTSSGYSQFEQRAIQFLESQGWLFNPPPSILRYDPDGKAHRWYTDGRHFVTTDGDSFGPMVRMFFDAQTPEKEFVDLLHG